jgi:hypothetical protein
MKYLIYYYLHYIYIKLSRRVSYKKEELLTHHEHLGSPPFFMWFVVVIIFVFCVVVFVLFVFVLCLAPKFGCVSGLSILDFLSNVYVQIPFTILLYAQM